MKEVTVRQAKVTDDNGITRSKVPVPILKAIGAKPGDYVEFERNGAGRATMRVLKKSVKKARAARK